MNITEVEFKPFERLRKSGTSMLLSDVVSQHTGLSHKKIMEILFNYSELKRKFQKEGVR